MSDKAPLLSVLMPVYNCAPFLQESVSSVLNQDFRDFELILVNDGSTDTSAEVLSAFSDSRIRIVTHPENRGLIPALLTGLAQCRGRFIARMDCDDYCLPQRFSTQLNFLQQHPEVGVCGSAMQLFPKKGKWLYPETHEEIKAQLLFSCCMGHPSVMMRREVFDTHTYDMRYLYAEDYGLWFELAPHTRLHNLPEVLINYRIHPQQISSHIRSEQQKTCDRIREEMLSRYFPECTVSQKAIHQKLARLDYPLHEKFLHEATQWLEYLWQENLRNRQFENSALQKVLSNKFTDLCLTLAPLGKTVWRTFNRSAFSKLQPLQTRTKLALKCLLRR